VGAHRVSLDKNRVSDFFRPVSGAAYAQWRGGVAGYPRAAPCGSLQLFRDSQDPLLQAPPRRDRQRLPTAI